MHYADGTMVQVGDIVVHTTDSEIRKVIGTVVGFPAESKKRDVSGLVEVMPTAAIHRANEPGKGVLTPYTPGLIAVPIATCQLLHR